jgi:SOS-response transcriptional repressor LexA/transcriptional regulator with XRE-family HTH domain
MTTFGKFTRDRMRQLGKSQKALAEELTVSPAYVSQVLSGKKKPPDLTRPKCVAQLRKWSNFLEASEEDILEMVRFELHSVPPRPPAKFPRMRELLLSTIAARTRTLSGEIRSMPLHPAENLVIQTMVRTYFVLQEEWNEGRAYGAERFKDFCRSAKSNREFVEADVVEFFKERSFTWSWDSDAGDIMFMPESAEIRAGMERVREILEKVPDLTRGLTVPIVGHVSAGEGFEYTDGGFSAGEGFDQVDFPPGVDPSLAPLLYCVRIRGDSLRDFLCDGALLFIKPESWEEIKDGDLVIFKDRRDRRAFVKKVEFAGDSLILKSMNPLYKNMVRRRSDLMLLERVTAIVL